MNIKTEAQRNDKNWKEEEEQEEDEEEEESAPCAHQHALMPKVLRPSWLSVWALAVTFPLRTVDPVACPRRAYHRLVMRTIMFGFAAGCRYTVCWLVAVETHASLFYVSARQIAKLAASKASWAT